MRGHVYGNLHSAAGRDVYFHLEPWSPEFLLLLLGVDLEVVFVRQPSADYPLGDLRSNGKLMRG